ncbi:MAG: hypothetical protein AAGB24_04660 [Bacteroidota bacterium]
MENSRLTTKILTEIEKLIIKSCRLSELDPNFQDFHKMLLKKYYNAADVCIDYHRHRITLDIIMNDEAYDPKTVNLIIPTIPANIFFKNLCDFLKSCLEKDVKSLAFYARLLKNYSNKDITALVI